MPDIPNSSESTEAAERQRAAQKLARAQQREIDQQLKAREIAASAASNIASKQAKTASRFAGFASSSVAHDVSRLPPPNAPFAIIHVQKHKTRASLSRILRHQLREGLVSNADPEKSHLNVRSGVAGNANAVTQKIFETTDPLMRRKDGVRAVELMLTASPEWFSRHGGTGTAQQLWHAALAFTRDTFGVENIISAGMHRDETTPHFWCVVTPIKDGNLSASRWLDGPQKMAALQDGWASKMAPLGCQRGAKKSAASHTAIKTYYSAVNGDKAAAATINRESTRRARRARSQAVDATKRLELASAELSKKEATVLQKTDALLDQQQRITPEARDSYSQISHDS